MAYVQLDIAGSVVGIFANPQPGNDAVTVIPDDDRRIAVFLNAKPQQISSSQFINRFPPNKMVTLAILAQTNPQMLLFLVGLAAASSINLTDPAVQGGVMALVPTVLTLSEAAVVLDH